MCFCCCPPAIEALLCLWIRSGFSKASVAGALTFFPPDPPWYKMERISVDGEVLPDDLEESGGTECTDDENDECQAPQDDDDDDVSVASSIVSKKPNPSPISRNKSEATDSSEELQLSLSARQKMLRKTAKKRNARDARDAANRVTFRFILDPRLRVPRFSGSIKATKIYNARKKSYIAATIYRRAEARYSVIYSHGNATDIGAMSLIASMISTGLNVNVVMYDYSGYGESGGVALEKNTYHDIDAVYNYVLQYEVNGDAEKIIVYGQSVGSGPSCYICAKKPAGGLILHSPFTSGMRVLTPNRSLAFLDIFPNINRIKRTQCPVMVIHGAQDREVDIGHGIAMHNAVPEIYQRDAYWVPDRGHNDIVEGPGKMREYIRRFAGFLESLDTEENIERI